MDQPRIGICSTTRVLEMPFAQVPAATAFNAYVEGVAAAGGVPVILPCLGPEWARRLVGSVDGVILTGGQDVDPSTYAGPPTDSPVDAARDESEIAVVLAARELGRPLLGICHGLQIVNVALGGSLLQHVDEHLDPNLRHVVDLQAGELAAIVGTTRLETNSLHHQATDRVGDGLRVTARAGDGVIEALEGDGLMAVQWHPELDQGIAASAPFAWIVARAAAGR
jgi:putative glutamine amidotransferase